MRLLTLSVFVLATLIGPEAAMAFNCSGITLPSSMVIGSDPDLTRLADERQQIYNEARSRLTPDQQNALWEDQKAWVRSYSECSMMGVCDFIQGEIVFFPPNPIIYVTSDKEKLCCSFI